MNQPQDTQSVVQVLKDKIKEKMTAQFKIVSTLRKQLSLVTIQILLS